MQELLEARDLEDSEVEIIAAIRDKIIFLIHPSSFIGIECKMFTQLSAETKWLDYDEISKIKSK